MAEIKLIDISALESMPRTQLTVNDVEPRHRERYYNLGMDFNKDLNLKGKYCYHPFNTVTIDDKGDCYICTCQAWLPIPVGNIMQFNSLDEIISSPKAREIQASIIDGTYKYCDHQTCHLISNNTLETRIDHRPDKINWIVFALDDSCNLSCPSCRTELIFHNKGEEFDRRMAISDHIVRLIEQYDHFLKFTLSGDGDPFASHIYRNMLEKLDLIGNSNVEIEIVTNGILVKSHWNRMIGIHDNVVRMRISFDAGTPEVYAKTRRGGDWNKLIESCKYIAKWKQKTYNDIELQAAFVVQETNYKDIPAFVNLALSLGFDSIMLQKVTDWGKWIEDGINFFSDHAVWMPDHAHYPELVEILNDPLMFNPKINLTNLTHLQDQKKKPTLSSVVELKQAVKDHISPLVNILDQNNITLRGAVNQWFPGMEKFNDEFVNIIRLNEQIVEKVTFIEKLLEAVDLKFDKEIAVLTKDFYQTGYKINNEEKLLPTDETTERLRVMKISEDANTAICSSILSYVDWQYPGLEIGPGDGNWTKHLVSCDPLYLVDVHQTFLDSAASQFHSDYQKRVRPYLTDGANLSMLPQGQFGFVFAWNVFNYLTPDVIDLYLGEIFKVLRPGGTAMFSYNNAERVNSAVFAETGYMSYMPKKHLLKLLNKYGFESVITKEFDESISWVEVRKPGDLHTVKAHQSLAQIVVKR